MTKLESSLAKKIVPYLRAAFKTRGRQATSLAAIAVLLYILKQRMSSGISKTDLKKLKSKPKSYWRRTFVKAWGLLKIAVPSLRSREFGYLSTLTVFLVLRTVLSIYLSSINGHIVKSIVENDYREFLKRIGVLFLLSVPASVVNSMLEYLNKLIATCFRERLTFHFHDKYVKSMVFYQITNLDARIQNPDQRLTQDIERWADAMANLYQNFTKPLFDIVLFSKKLAETVGWQGPAVVYFWYLISGFIIKFVSPPFGKLTTIEQKMEGEYRGHHTDMLNHAEEIAFFKGHVWEEQQIRGSFLKLYRQIISTVKKRFYMGIFDSMLVKYGAMMVGYSVLGLPVFGPGREEYIKRVGTDTARITGDYMRNSSLLINLAKAIGKMVVSYKSMQDLAGYTTLVSELEIVIDELHADKYERIMLDESVKGKRGRYIEEDGVVRFQDVPLLTPSGDFLAKPLSFEAKRGMHLMVVGPNGCGKSSLFRILSQLWPAFAGEVVRPQKEKIFYVPQRPYLPPGTLRDQIIYPHTKMQMMRKKRKSEKDLFYILERVNLAYLVEREGGWDAINDWNDVLSGGEKQRMGMARLFYHLPQFAILDDCTSAVSVDVEDSLYSFAKELGLTLITVSHRLTLWAFHDFVLKFDEEGGWSFERIIQKKT